MKLGSSQIQEVGKRFMDDHALFCSTYFHRNSADVVNVEQGIVQAQLVMSSEHKLKTSWAFIFYCIFYCNS